MHLPSPLLQPVPCLPACTQLQAGAGDTGTWAAAEKGPSGTGSGAMGRYSQQPERAEALEGQRRDALQGVVAEDPAEGEQEAAQRRGNCRVCCKKPTLGCMLPQPTHT